MKILHTIYDDVGNPWLGGGGAVRAAEINRRLSREHDITVVCGRYPGAPESQTRDGYRVVRVGTDGGYAVSRLGFMGGATEWVSGGDYDVWVYTFSAYAPLYAGAAARRKAVLEFHHHMGRHAVRQRPLAGLPAWWAESTVLPRYDTVVGVSPSVVDAIAKRRGSQGLHLVYNGVHDVCFETPTGDDDYVLFFGRFDVHNKGIDVLLDAFASSGLTGLRLVLAGRSTPETETWIRSRASRLGIEQRVGLEPNASDDRKAELMGRCRFAVQPSRFEGWGITALEIAAAGKAVLATRIPGLVDAVRDNETGILVPSEDAGALAEGMRRLAGSEELRNELGRAARDYAARFKWDEVARQHLDVCRQVVERTG